MDVFIIYFNGLTQNCYGYSLYLNGFMKKMASYLGQNRLQPKND